MTDIVASPAITHSVTGIEIRYSLSLTGPPVRGRFSSVDTCPRSMRVHMALTGGAVQITKISVFGQRAKKDGTPGSIAASAEWYVTSNRMPEDVPAWLWTIARAVRSTVETIMEAEVDL